MLSQTIRSSFSLLLLSTIPANAMPTFPNLQPNGMVHRAGNASVYICDDAFWSGNCVHRSYAIGSGACEPLNGKASSIGPDQGFSCIFYKNGVCRSLEGNDTLTLAYPGIANLIHTEKGNFNDAVLSFQCYDKE